MCGWFCQIRLIYPIGWKCIHFEKKNWFEKALLLLVVHLHSRRVRLRPAYDTLHKERTAIRATAANKRSQSHKYFSYTTFIRSVIWKAFGSSAKALQLLAVDGLPFTN